MRYFEWIREYRQGKLTATDRQAFEHEMKDNASLRAEPEAVELTELLLREASVKGIQNTKAEQAPGGHKHWKPYILTTGIGLILLGIALWWYSTAGIVSNDESETEVPVEQNWTPNIFPGKSETPDDQLPPAPVQTTTPIAGLSSPKNDKDDHPGVSFKKHQKMQLPRQEEDLSAHSGNMENIADVQNDRLPFAVSPNAVAVYTVQAVLDDTFSPEKSVALTATEKITLKPGFHAKAGTSFKAKVNDSPLFQ
ncbi:MAG: hypothetical protein KDD15_12980 [Lewinella sp.]|nr:hypothetical protein [Lewinella sp.]